MPPRRPRRPARRSTSPWRHAAGYETYRASTEQTRHVVTSTFMEKSMTKPGEQAEFCSQCAWPVTRRRDA